MKPSLASILRVFGLAVFILLGTLDLEPLMGQKFVANEDESKVPAYVLPPILAEPVATPDEAQRAWEKRRPELLRLFAEQMFGTAPTGAFQVRCKRFEQGPSLKGRALRQQFRVVIETAAGKLPIEFLVFTPASSSKPVPCFLGLNFTGNHTVIADPEIPVTQTWMRNDSKKGITNNRASEKDRGAAASRWPIDLIIDRGCGVATAYYGDIDPDFDDGFTNGVHALFPDHRPTAEHPERWGTIAGWAWGMSRLLDALIAEVPQIDSRRVAVIGHSRLGKTALWAGATDPRFAYIISNDSGCGGAALSRRAFGETVGRINESFPHWFCPNFHRFGLREAELPTDQHQLIALMAPRPVYVASASQDLWADPRGEFLSAKIAGDFYKQLGLQGLPLEEFPEPGQAAIGRVSYHLREGAHDINAWDWERYLGLMELDLAASP